MTVQQTVQATITRLREVGRTRFWNPSVSGGECLMQALHAITGNRQEHDDAREAIRVAAGNPEFVCVWNDANDDETVFAVLEKIAKS